MSWPALLFLASSGYKGYSELQSGYEERATRFQRAEGLLMDANDERETAAMRAYVTRQAGEGQQSEARAGFASANIEVGEGTAGFVETSIAALAEQDALTEILYGEKRAKAAERAAELERQAGQDAAKRGRRGLVGSILGGGAAMMGAWK